MKITLVLPQTAIAPKGPYIKIVELVNIRTFSELQLTCFNHNGTKLISFDGTVYSLIVDLAITESTVESHCVFGIYYSGRVPNIDTWSSGSAIADSITQTIKSIRSAL